MDPASRHSLADQANKNATSITTISVLDPLALGVLGIIVLLTATSPWRRFRRHPGDDPDEDTGPCHPTNFDLLPGTGKD
jgi:hypothetical protein